MRDSDGSLSLALRTRSVQAAAAAAPRPAAQRSTADGSQERAVEYADLGGAASSPGQTGVSAQPHNAV